MHLKMHEVFEIVSITLVNKNENEGHHQDRTFVRADCKLIVGNMLIPDSMHLCEFHQKNIGA